MLHRSTSLLNQLLGLLFPDRCIGCQRIGLLLCSTCRTRLTPYDEPLPLLPPLAKAHVAYVYAGPLRGVVHNLKYRGTQRAAALLAELLVQQIDWHALAVDAIVAVPLHKDRLAARGFNQSELIARAVAQQLRLPLLTHGLVRTQFARSQVGLNSVERQANVAGAFCWQHHAPPPQRIALLDDLLTTGSTLQACATALQAAGSQQIVAVAVARSRLAPTPTA